MNKKSKKWVKREKQRRDVAWTIACWFLRRTIWYWLNMTNRGDGGVGCLIYNSRPPGFINSHAHPSEQNSFQHILPALLLPRHKLNIEWNYVIDDLAIDEEPCFARAWGTCGRVSVCGRVAVCGWDHTGPGGGGAREEGNRSGDDGWKWKSRDEDWDLVSKFQSAVSGSLAYVKNNREDLKCAPSPQSQVVRPPEGPTALCTSAGRGKLFSWTFFFFFQR